jgi:hypothetical protein
MLHVVPPHPPLESDEDRRDAVRRRATPTLLTVGVAVCIGGVLLLSQPQLAVVVLVTFAAGLVVGRRL